MENDGGSNSNSNNQQTCASDKVTVNNAENNSLNDNTIASSKSNNNDNSHNKEGGQTKDTENTTKDTDMSSAWQEQAQHCKVLGDSSFRLKDYAQAIQHYTAALSLDPDNATILSNRSAAYLVSGISKSKALHDAQACVQLGGMGLKGYSRLAAAQQALGRYVEAYETWKKILAEDPQHKAALQGVSDCEPHLPKQSKHDEDAPAAKDDVDELDDFFDDVEQVVQDQKVQKAQAMEDKPTKAIANSKQSLGTVDDQISRLLAPHYAWKNLNPYLVLDIDHTASLEDVARRYKALSLLLHPDKNQSHARPDQVQLAYDEVLKAKQQIIDNPDKRKHVQDLIEQGMIQGKRDYKEQKELSLEDCQKKAVQRLFAQVEQARREVEARERKQEQREKQQEREEIDKQKQSMAFDKNWQQDERVNKRIGSWREFSTKKKKVNDEEE
jgi:DnaJ homolog subfamily C member 8